MIFKPCFLIPIYNHKDTISYSVGKLVLYKLPILIVDDGSNLETQKTLIKLASDVSLVRLIRLPLNCGKGAAVMRGLQEAEKFGYSHALQIDADGQHDTTDVPRFLELGRSHPNAMICGKPIYDKSVPKGRLYGRYITRFWVRIETLSQDISDSMCGFRLYPLAATCRLIDEAPLPKRMDFDIAILVRLSWRGLAFKNIDTRVIYPPEGLSHFNMLRDNLRISRTHTLLTIGMLLRLPILLWRKNFAHNNTHEHWSKIAERGSLIGLHIVSMCYRLCGETATRILLYPIVAYFLATNAKSRAASLSYLRKINTYRALQTSSHLSDVGWRESFIHMLSFAQAGIDKLAAWMGVYDNRRIDCHDLSELDRLIESKRGAVLIASHLGNIEMTRAIATSQRRAAVNAIVYTDHAQHFNETLAKTNDKFALNLIQVSHLGPETAILLKEKIDCGELIVIVGDRTPPTQMGSSNRINHVEFLGQPAPFAQGPFILASLLECPVYLFFCLREGDAYQIYLEPFAERIVLPRRGRKEQLQGYIQQYARRLEAYCLKAPYQWFNFYDFWR